MRGESSCRGEKMPMLCIERLFGLACQGNEGSVHPFTLHTAMHGAVPSWLADWHTLKDQQSNHLALARCWLRHGWSQTRGAGEESLRHSFQYHFSWRVGACPVCCHSSLNLYHLQPDWVFSGNAYQSQILEIKKKMDCSSDLDFICIM